MHDLSETIVAVATPPGRGGIGCVRLSGPAAHAIAAALFLPARESETGPLRFGRFLGRDGTPVDHGYLVTFPRDGAFTGEESAELWAHGSPAVLRELVEASAARGARPAGPGEFTYRALRNGRVDLPKAEAVRDLVAARTLWQARLAFSQAEGGLARRLRPLAESLDDLAARAEAAVEFVDEPETEEAAAAFADALESARRDAASLARSFRAGLLVREGATVAITGLPNVGKSSLFNALLARERAIVSEVPGTTRDVLEEGIDLDGVPVRLVDTAGLREVEDPVETEGVRRARSARAEADLVLLVLDGSRALAPAEEDALSEAPRTIVAANKCDLPAGTAAAVPGAVLVSAKTGEGLDGLRTAIAVRLGTAERLDDPVLADPRHAIAIEGAAAALERARGALDAGLSEEAVLEDVREARHRLGEITGEFGTEDLLDRIFSTFCIGK